MNTPMKDSYSGPWDAEREKNEQRPAVPFVSEAIYNRTEKDNGKYIEIICRCTPTRQETKTNNYNVHVRIYDDNISEDMLLWFTKFQNAILITELILVGYARRNFLRVKTEIYDVEVTTDDSAVITKRGVIEETLKKVLERFWDYAIKKFVVQYQVSYVHHRQYKPGRVLKEWEADLFSTVVFFLS